MVLIDTSVVIPWMDTKHPAHARCETAIAEWAEKDELAVSVVTLGELAAGGRVREGVEADLAGLMSILPLDADSAWRAGLAFRRVRPNQEEPGPVLPDFLIRGQAATKGHRHLTRDLRNRSLFPDVDFIPVED